MKKHFGLKNVIAGIGVCAVIAGAAVGCVNTENNGEEETTTTTGADTVTSTEESTSTHDEKEVVMKTSMTDALSRFGAKLFKNTLDGEGDDANVLISPYSVYMALGMAANGATGESLSQMEKVLGMKSDDINKVLSAYPNLREGSGNVLRSANSIWINKKEGFSVKEDFKNKLADSYSTEAQLLSFDASAKDKINNWVSEKTDKMINSIVDDISPDTLMYLINALAFDAKWENPYSTDNLEDAQFTREDGSKDDVTLMHSKEGYYFKDEKAEGFKKYYENGDYSFLAIKPNEGVSIKEYVNGLSDEDIMKLAGKEDERFESKTVYAAIPKFKSDYFTELSEVLKNTGMTAPFAGGFEGISEDKEVLISGVLHKTHIDVYEEGTKAAAVTAVVLAGSAMIEGDIAEVYLDRPFIYMIIDEINHMPLFIGNVMQIGL